MCVNTIIINAQMCTFINTHIYTKHIECDIFNFVYYIFPPSINKYISNKF